MPKCQSAEKLLHDEAESAIFLSADSSGANFEGCKLIKCLETSIKMRQTVTLTGLQVMAKNFYTYKSQQRKYFNGPAHFEVIDGAC